MGFHLFPRPSYASEASEELRAGTTHAKEAPCPFAQRGLPACPFGGTCCSFNSRAAAYCLAVYGECEVSDWLNEDQSESYTLELGETLREIAAKLRRRHPGKPKRARGQENTVRDVGRFSSWPHPTPEEAIAAIEQAAFWYETVGSLGFKVRAF